MTLRENNKFSKTLPGDMGGWGGWGGRGSGRKAAPDGSGGGVGCNMAVAFSLHQSLLSFLSTSL